MSTITVGDQPLTMVRGRSGMLPMRWQSPSGAAIDISGFVLASKLRWSRREVALTIQATDAVGGRFKASWAGSQIADIPLGRLSVLIVSLVDPAGEAHDFEFPVIGKAL